MLNAQTRICSVLFSITLLANFNQTASIADEETKPTEKPKITNLRLRSGINVGSSPLDLVRRTNVQRELELNDEQLFQIREAFKANRPPKFDREKFKDLTKAELKKRLSEHRQADFARQKKLEGLMIKILNDDQIIRLREIVVQRRGIGVFSDAEFVQEIPLEGEQLKQIQALISVYKEERKKFFAELPSLKPNDRKRKAALYLRSIPVREQKLSDEILRVMTTPQREKFLELRGERFELLQ